MIQNVAYYTTTVIICNHTITFNWVMITEQQQQHDNDYDAHVIILKIFHNTIA